MDAKNNLVDTAKDTTSKQPVATAETVIYDTVGPPNQTSNKGDMEVVNPAYNRSQKVTMSTNHAYESCK